VQIGLYSWDEGEALGVLHLRHCFAVCDTNGQNIRTKAKRENIKRCNVYYAWTFGPFKMNVSGVGVVDCTCNSSSRWKDCGLSHPKQEN
jgi:hypothetical protein